MLFLRSGRTRLCLMALLSQRRRLCVKRIWGKYPVIFISLKGVDGLTYELAIK